MTTEKQSFILFDILLDMEGIEPKAASEGAKKWRETHGGGYWGSHKIPDNARANMKLAQQKRGKAVRAFAPDGTWQDFNTMNDAAKALGMGVGSIANNLKSNGVCNNGYRFKTTVPDFSRPYNQKEERLWMSFLSFLSYLADDVLVHLRFTLNVLPLVLVYLPTIFLEPPIKAFHST